MPDCNDLDLLWVMLSAFLVFLMQFGFALIETGTVRAKNTINVAMKNLVDMIFGVIVFWMVGFGLMFGNDLGGLVGSSLFCIDGTDPAASGFFFFQAMFAATAITIVSGAVAERMKFNGYVFIAIMVITLIYPVFGHWAWADGGWLKTLGFTDFAGSTVVHSVGAWIGLAGAIVLGPRLGRFRRGKVMYFAPSNHNFIVFGVFILWFSWFGFNAGSLLAFDDSVTTILLNTLISGAFGGLAAYLVSLFTRQHVAVEIFTYGIIAGLVGITAGCASVDTFDAALIGFVSALIMFVGDQWLRNLQIDDPLSVVSIHGFSGMWGTMAVGFFGRLPEEMGRFDFIVVQFIGIVSAFAFAFLSGLLLFTLLLRFKALRVSHRNEIIGLNLAEHDAKLPWVDTVESIIKIMRSGDLSAKVYEERGTEVGIVARFFNYLLDMLRKKQSELTTSNSKLRAEASHDPLTGILNRRGLIQTLTKRNPSGKSYSLIIIDIDHFKKVNDTFGHPAGDAILQEIALTVRRELRDSDLFARWGGEEFLVALRTDDLAQAERVAEKLRGRIERSPFSTVGSVTCSFGVSSPKNSGDFDTLFTQADKALYQAKKLGRNRVCSW